MRPDHLFIKAEGGQVFMDTNFTPNMVALGNIGDTQDGLPVNASSPFMYINADLVRMVGDPETMPTNFPELIDLAKKIHESDPEVTGTAYGIVGWPDDWLWQAMITQQGGTMVDAEAGKVASTTRSG